MNNERSAPRPRRPAWLVLLSVVGVVLTVGAVALIVLVVTGTIPVWALALLSVGIWGPITLTASIVLSRYVIHTKRLRAIGTPVRATIVAIHQTASQIGGRPVLRLALSITLPGRPEYEVSIRNAPPYHLVSMLRPGAVLPALVDPDDPRQAMIDWPVAERESSPR